MGGSVSMATSQLEKKHCKSKCEGDIVGMNYIKKKMEDKVAEMSWEKEEIWKLILKRQDRVLPYKMLPVDSQQP